METEHTQTTDQTRYLILDTNILSRAGAHIDGKNNIGTAIVENLKEVLLKSPGWDIALSAVTIFELTDRSTLENEMVNEQAIGGMKIFDVNLEILRCAGRLGSFYTEQNINDTQISSMDKIIGATAHMTGSVIYTTDMRDYPAPFFNELVNLRKVIEYTSKAGVPVFLPTYFMIPSADILQKYYDKRILPFTTNQTKLEKHLALKPVKALLQSPTVSEQKVIEPRKITKKKKRKI